MAKVQNSRRIMLIGGVGFIGHHIAIDLRAGGHEVLVIDSLQVNNLGSLAESQDPNAINYLSFISDRLQALRDSQVQIATSDARDYERISRHVSDFEPDVIVHLAAVAHANRSNKDPKSTFDHSLRTLENVLDASRRGKPQLIFFSSSMVYGDFGGHVVDEDSPLQPKGIYGSLKLAGELMVRSYSEVFDIPHTIVRPSALYGERCVSRRVGQAFIENAIAGRSLTINGDGQEELDFTYILDVVAGVRAMILEEKSYNQTFNLTYGEGRSLNDLATIVMGRFDGIGLQHNSRDALMPERGSLDNSKIRQVLGFHSAFPIEVGFNMYLDWYLGRHAGKTWS